MNPYIFNMHLTFAQRRRVDWPGKLACGTALLLAALATSCKDPGYRTEVYPGQQGQYTVQHVPETPRPADSSALVQTEAQAPPPAVSGGPAPAAAPMPSTAPIDDNLSQVEAVWPKLSESDKALLVQTAKHLAGQR